MDEAHPTSMEAQLKQLQARVGALENALRRSGIALPEPERPTPPAPIYPRPLSVDEPILPGPLSPINVPAAPPPLVPLRNVTLTSPLKPRQNGSLENRIGSQWFNRIGIVALLIGVSWFLKLAFDNHWIGPLGRIVIGLVAGAGLIAWSERFRRKGFPAFSYSLKAVGSGTLYLSLWAAFSVYHLLPSSIAFAAMILVTAFNGYMAWHQDAELLALYSIVGGLSTPILVSTGQNHEIALFTYLFLLDLAVLTLVILKPWSRLLFSAFAGTAFYTAGWYFSFYSNLQLGRTSLLLTAFFLLFAFAPRLIRLKPNAKVDAGWDFLALGLLPVANAALVFLTFYDMLERRGTTWAEPWLAILFAAFYLLLLKVPATGVLKPNTALSSALTLTATVVFLALAIPLKTHGRWLTVGWLVEGAALLWVARRTRLPLLRFLALLCLGLGLCALITINPPATATPLLNQRFATYCVAIAVLVFAASLSHRASRDDSPDDKESPAFWSSLIPFFVVLVNLLVLVAISLEIHGYWWYVRWRANLSLLHPWGSGESPFHDYLMYAQFTYSAFFMLYGALLLAIGFWRHSAFLRWQALILLAVSIAKVFLADTSTLSQGYRILSFLGLGVLLLAVSFVYQRDWLHLRTPERDVA